MWHSEMRRAEPLIDWPTDGIPTVRLNLGVIFVPAMAGLDYQLPGDAMPWPGEPLARGDPRGTQCRCDDYRDDAPGHGVLCHPS